MFIANQDLSEDSILYPVKLTVQGLQVRLESTGQQLGIGTSRPATPIPAAREPSAKPASPSDIVISQVYGGGGNTGAIFTHDFIELFNRSTTPISLAGWSVQYASASGASNFGAGATLITELPNFSLAPGQYLLIQEARGNAGTSPLANPDVIDPTPIALSATDGKVTLVRTSAPLGCNGGTNPCLPGVLTNIIDLAGYGKADFFLGWGTAPAGTNTSGILRLNNGCKDTRSNAEDFTVGAPNPRNSTSARVPCSTAPPKP
ncbi:MAG: lamin tail domain-containing protein [Chloroflexota bacterium]